MLRLARHRVAVGITVALALVLFQSAPRANHSWNGYHWARTSNPFLVDLGNNLSGSWNTYLAVASSDWSQSRVLDTAVVTGGSNKRNCRPTAGRVEVCNSTYGNTGWLGVAQIWVSGSHITQGTVKMNDTYFASSTYNSPAWRQFVVCQEVGHTFGLDHQDEAFDNANLGTCMDYTNNPGTNQHPNTHDYDELEAIYSHLDSVNTAGAAAPSATAGAVLDNPSQWGQLMKVSHGGKTQTFERDFGNGQRVVTFVIWA
jgi:hypothetical protein